MRKHSLLQQAFLIAAIAGPPAAAADEFDAPQLSDQWCACQIDIANSPVTFPINPERSGDRFARIFVDAHSIGGNECRRKAPDLECGPPPQTAFARALEEDDRGIDAPETLGPALPGDGKPAMPFSAKPDPYCTDDIWTVARAAGEENECIQRQEIQPQKWLQHDEADPHVYSIRFRMPAIIKDTTNSIRWVVGQWKQDPVSQAYKHEFGPGWGPSPFLSQRFDDGVLRVTVQDEHCRCVVASAEPQIWTDGVPQLCQSTRPGDPDNAACTPNLKAEYGPDPLLPSPRGRWVELSYRVEAGLGRDARIEIYSGSRFIARITGDIGYRTDPTVSPVIKFKIGHYRDYMPSVDTIDIDWIRIERAGL